MNMDGIIADLKTKLGSMEQQHGLPSGLLDNQIRAESNYNPNAVSPSGAVGISQFMPSTARQYGIDPRDPVQSVNAQAQMMSELHKKYGGDTDKALAAYNAGMGNVDAAVKQAKKDGGDWKGYLPKPEQTLPYIDKIKRGMELDGVYNNVFGGKSSAEQPQQPTIDHAKLDSIYGEVFGNKQENKAPEAPLIAQVGKGASEVYGGIKQFAAN